MKLSGTSALVALFLIIALSATTLVNAGNTNVFDPYSVLIKICDNNRKCDTNCVTYKADPNKCWRFPFNSGMEYFSMKYRCERFPKCYTTSRYNGLKCQGATGGPTTEPCDFCNNPEKGVWRSWADCIATNQVNVMNSTGAGCQGKQGVVYSVKSGGCTDIGYDQSVAMTARYRPCTMLRFTQFTGYLDNETCTQGVGSGPGEVQWQESGLCSMQMEDNDKPDGAGVEFSCAYHDDDEQQKVNTPDMKKRKEILSVEEMPEHHRKIVRDHMVAQRANKKNRN